ncbi:MAG: phosphomethylpyrimidine synthase ThiC, partial [Candidatus Methanoperedens sp.]|nr:phosphomethylpyrimidine synthase ThiC [Candidatus Methanoperedens sp.]
LERIAMGSVAIMSRGEKQVGIGRGLATKVNVNIGTSSLKISPDEEVKKAQIAEKYGADTITDLSMGGNITGIRRKIFENTTLPITTVPIYQTAAEKGLPNMNEDDIIKNIKKQAEEGMSSFVLHCIDNKTLGMLKKGNRIMGVVSKGGSITCAYMMLNMSENPFIENFDGILKILKKYDIVLSLGNTMRSGCIHDARDKAQLEEIRLNVELAKRAHQVGVQAIIEGMGGHVRADRIAEYVRFHKRQSDFPLFVAGPLPTDVAVGYDHIAGCVGASIASGAGADYLCYITPSEHLGLPGTEQVREGLVAFKIAAHIGDSIKYGLNERDRKLAEKRAELDWEGQLSYAIDGERARALAPEEGPCTMCGDFCAIKIMKEFR